MTDNERIAELHCELQKKDNLIKELKENLKAKEGIINKQIIMLQKAGDTVTIKGTKRDIELLMVGAFRYAVKRHRTEAMWSYEDVILNNLDMLGDGFIKQFIDGIEFEKNCENASIETLKKWRREPWARLEAHVKDYLFFIGDLQGEEVERMRELLNLVMEQADKVEIPEDTHGFPVESTEYLNNMLKTLKAEYRKRGYYEKN